MILKKNPLWRRCSRQTAHALVPRAFLCVTLSLTSLAPLVSAQAGEAQKAPDALDNAASGKAPAPPGKPAGAKEPSAKEATRAAAREQSDKISTEKSSSADGDGEKSGDDVGSAAVADAEKLLSRGDVSEAIEVLQKAVRDDTRSAPLREKLGQCYYLVGETGRAIDEMKKAVAIAPRESGCQCNLAWLYTRAGNFGDAIRSANTAISLDPKRAYPYILLGFAYGSMNRREQAIEALQKALEIDSGNVTAHVYLGDVLLARGDFQKAVESYSKALEIDDKIVGAHIGLGNSYGKLGQQDKQIESYRSAVKVAPRDADAHGHLGFALSQTGDLIGGMKEGFIANSMRVDTAWDKFMGMFVAVWAGIFIVFGIIFGVLFLGSNFKPQPGETLLKSFLLTFHKEKPGRLVVTSRRIVYVPELFSKSFGATRLSIERSEIAGIDVVRNTNSGTLTIKSTSDTVHTFRMPTLVLEPMVKLLENEGLVGGSGSAGGGDREAKIPVAAVSEPVSVGEPESKEEEQVIAASFDFRPADDFRPEISRPEGSQNKDGNVEDRA